ncbi:MAG: NifU family protein [Rickettsiales bacterium]
MFIQTEDTPNPNSLKFIPEDKLNNSKGPINFGSLEDAEKSPLAKTLFSIDGVNGVFYGSDFITISKRENVDWPEIKPLIMLTIMEHFSKKIPLYNDEKQSKSTGSNEINEDDSAVVKEIKEIIEHRVRPAVAQDGGDIIFHSFKDGILKLELHGACSGCPSSTVTLKNGIENMIRHYVPEIESVEAINAE